MRKYISKSFSLTDVSSLGDQKETEVFSEGLMAGTLSWAPWFKWQWADPQQAGLSFPPGKLSRS